jgi:hypothetical protein
MNSVSICEDAGFMLAVMQSFNANVAENHTFLHFPSHNEDLIRGGVLRDTPPRRFFRTFWRYLVRRLLSNQVGPIVCKKPRCK